MGDKTGDIFAGITIVTMLWPFLWWLSCAVAAGMVAGVKNRTGPGYFCATFFFLGPLGLAVAMLVEPVEPSEDWSPPAATAASRPTAPVHQASGSAATEDRHGIGWFLRGLRGKWD